MAYEIERVLFHAEDFLLRTLRPGPAREARKRRTQRKLLELLRRIRRAGLMTVGLLAVLVAVSIFIAPIGIFTWLVAIPTVFLVAFLSLFWPTRQAATPLQSGRMTTPAVLAERAADGLLDRCEELPGRALPAAEAIVARLRELAPHLEGQDSDMLRTGEASRLIGQHLPRLVDTYLALPLSERTGRSEASTQLTASLETVAQELDDLLERCCRDRRLRFETQRRFIETRYGEDEDLRAPGSRS